MTIATYHRSWFYGSELYSLEDEVLAVCPRSSPGTLAWSRIFADVLRDVCFWRPGQTAPSYAALVTRGTVELWDLTSRRYVSAIPPWGGSAWHWLRGEVDGLRRRLYLTVERGLPMPLARKVVGFDVADPRNPVFIGEATLAAGNSNRGGTLRHTGDVGGRRLLLVAQSGTSTRVLDVTGGVGIGQAGPDVLPYLSAMRVSGDQLYGLRGVGDAGTATVSAWDLSGLGDGSPWAEAALQDRVCEDDTDAISVRRAAGEDLIAVAPIHGWPSGLGGQLASLRAVPGVTLTVDGALDLETPGPSPASMERIDLSATLSAPELVVGRVYPPASGDRWTYYLGTYRLRRGAPPQRLGMTKLHA